MLTRDALCQACQRETPHTINFPRPLPPPRPSSPPPASRARPLGLLDSLPDASGPPTEPIDPSHRKPVSWRGGDGVPSFANLQDRRPERERTGVLLLSCADEGLHGQRKHACKIHGTGHAGVSRACTDGDHSSAVKTSLALRTQTVEAPSCPGHPSPWYEGAIAGTKGLSLSLSRTLHVRRPHLHQWTGTPPHACPPNTHVHNRPDSHPTDGATSAQRVLQELSTNSVESIQGAGATR